MAQNPSSLPTNAVWNCFYDFFKSLNFLLNPLYPKIKYKIAIWYLNINLIQFKYDNCVVSVCLKFPYIYCFVLFFPLFYGEL